MRDSFRLQELSLFLDMPDTTIDALLGQVSVEEKYVSRGETILMQGDHYTQLHILAEGSVFSEMIDVSGKAVRIQALRAPEVLAPGIIFSRHDTLPGSVFAETDSRLFTISRQDLGTLCGLDTQFRENFLRLISDRFVFISKRMSFLSFTTIKGKIAQYLLTLPGREEGPVILPIKIEELAGYFGAARPSVSRAFIELEREDYIRKNANRVEILDAQGLKELLL